MTPTEKEITEEVKEIRSDIDREKKKEFLSTPVKQIEITPDLAKLDEEFSDEMEPLEIALEKEYMSYDFYKRTTALVQDPDSKRLLHELAAEERNHADILLKQVSQIVRQQWLRGYNTDDF